MPSTPGLTVSPSMTNCLYLFFSAASTIQGIALAPVITAARDQPHAIAVALDPQAVDPMQAQRAESCTS
jgi:hypothetical protein